MKDLLESCMFKGFLAYVLLAIAGYGLIHAQPPAWLKNMSSSSQPPPSGGSASATATGGLEIIKPKVITKVVERVKRDTITVIKVDTIVKIDTLYPSKPIYYNYTIYYEIVDKKLALQKSFFWDFSNTAQKTQLQSSDTTLLSLGKESLRESSYTYDNLGNKTQTFEKIIEGLDMRISGANANITYRVDKNLLTLNGKFDGFGLLQLSSDFSRRRYFLYFIPLDFLGIFEKYTLFLRVEKSEVK